MNQQRRFNDGKSRRTCRYGSETGKSCGFVETISDRDPSWSFIAKFRRFDYYEIALWFKRSFQLVFKRLVSILTVVNLPDDRNLRRVISEIIFIVILLISLRRVVEWLISQVTTSFISFFLLSGLTTQFETCISILVCYFRCYVTITSSTLTSKYQLKYEFQALVFGIFVRET